MSHSRNASATISLVNSDEHNLKLTGWTQLTVVAWCGALSLLIKLSLDSKPFLMNITIDAWPGG